MADFAQWMTAAESALGWQKGEFMRIYSGNREDAVELALDSDLLGAALRDYMTHNSNWSGNWKELIQQLAGDKPARDWPNNGKAVAIRLKRLAPALRHFGIHYKAVKDGKRRFYNIWKDRPEPADDNANNESNPTPTPDDIFVK